MTIHAITMPNRLSAILYRLSAIADFFENMFQNEIIHKCILTVYRIKCTVRRCQALFLGDNFCHFMPQMSDSDKKCHIVTVCFLYSKIKKLVIKQ